MSAANEVGTAAGRRGRRLAPVGAGLCVVGVVVALVSVFGPLRGLWYVVAVAAAALGACLLVLGSSRRRPARIALVAAVVVIAVAVVIGPWLTQSNLSLGAESTQAADQPVFVHGEEGLAGVSLPGSGRYVDWSSVDEPAVFDDEAVSSSGWVFRADTTADDRTVYALDLEGHLLWKREIGLSDDTFGLKHRHGVVAATAKRAVLLRCRGEKGRCTLEAVDRRGHTEWTRRVPADSRSRQDLWDGETQVPTRPWLYSGDVEHDTARTTLYRPSDGRAVRRVEDISVVRLTPREVLLVAEKGKGSGCRVSLVRQAKTAWTHDYDGAGCGVLRQDVQANRSVAYPAPGAVMDLRSGEIHHYAVVGDAERAADLVLDNESRVWVTDPLSGGVLWRVPHDATVLAGPSFTAAYWSDRSVNPFRPRAEDSDSDREVTRVRVAPAGSRDPVTCDLPAEAELLAVVGAHTLVVDVDDEVRLWMCR